jgi:hypothetical protein
VANSPYLDVRSSLVHIDAFNIEHHRRYIAPVAKRLSTMQQRTNGSGMTAYKFMLVDLNYRSIEF